MSSNKQKKGRKEIKPQTNAINLEEFQDVLNKAALPKDGGRGTSDPNNQRLQRNPASHPSSGARPKERFRNHSGGTRTAPPSAPWNDPGHGHIQPRQQFPEERPRNPPSYSSAVQKGLHVSNQSGPSGTRNAYSHGAAEQPRQHFHEPIRRSPSESNLCHSPPIIGRRHEGPPGTFKEPMPGMLRARADSGYGHSEYQEDEGREHTTLDNLSELLQGSSLSGRPDTAKQVRNFPPPESSSRHVPPEPPQTGPMLPSIDSEKQKGQQYLRGYLPRIQTDFQKRFLRLLMNQESQGNKRNAMFALFEVHDIHADRLLHYNHYVNQDDEMHSEAFLLQDLQAVQCCIGKQILEITNSDVKHAEDLMDQNMTMYMLSKNSPCLPCADILIKFVGNCNKQRHNYSVPKITKLSVQYLQHYRSKTIDSDKGLQKLIEYRRKTGFNIEIKSLDRKQFFAAFAQWSYTRQACKAYRTPCTLRDTDTTDDKLYYDILSDQTVKSLTFEDIDDRLARLGVINTAEEEKKQETDEKGFRTFLREASKD
ncbi:uncharacterized protein [Amphiura filiformis]|uniref:uncharacterized protein n=1 Tax=Amphiura filiformis TaxID=82378 RepID=UPI003B215D1E